MDEDFAYFLRECGPAIETDIVPPSSIDRYRGKLPDRLLQYWSDLGWSGFADGLFWMVNPQEYEPVLKAWIGGTSFMEQDTYYIFARTAFGELYLWGERTGDSLTIDTFDSLAFPSEGSAKYIAEGKADEAMGWFFSGLDREDADMEDDSERFMFARALKRLGRLKKDEMYGFVPAIALGGSAVLPHLEKIKAIPHLMLLAQLASLRTK